MNVIEGATLPNDMDMAAASLSNKEIEELSTPRVIFFAGDDVPFSQKNEMPSIKAFGGVYMPHLKTLPKANKGMVYRCQLTRLTTQKIIENRQMLPPDAREGGKWERGFIQSVRNPDGTYTQKEVIGFQGGRVTEEGQFINRVDGAHLFANRYPGTDVRQAVRRSQPHGPGGVVEITALKGASPSEVLAAQVFFFPNWMEIRKGKEHLPETMRALEDHIKARMKEIPVELHDQYTSIGNAMLRSCQEFRTAYLQTFQKNETILEDAKRHNHASAAFPESAEQAMGMLEYKRKDDLVAGESSSVDRLARIMEQKEAKQFLLEERKQYVAELQAGLRERDFNEEIRLGIRKPNDVPVVKVEAPEPTFIEDPVTGQVDVVAQVQSVQEQYDALSERVQSAQPNDVLSSVPEADERLCGRPTANGTCNRVLRPEEESCWQHK